MIPFLFTSAATIPVLVTVSLTSAVAVASGLTAQLFLLPFYTPRSAEQPGGPWVSGRQAWELLGNGDESHRLFLLRSAEMVVRKGGRHKSTGTEGRVSQQRGFQQCFGSLDVDQGRLTDLATRTEEDRRQGERDLEAPRGAEVRRGV